jgi:hypothetical protein
MKTLERVSIDWNDLKSISRGEKKKARLENAGYTLIHSGAGLFRAVLVYSLKVQP